MARAVRERENARNVARNRVAFLFLRNVITAGHARHSCLYFEPLTTRPLHQDAETAAGRPRRDAAVVRPQGPNLLPVNSPLAGIAVGNETKVTWNGDANLDGRITSDDYFAIDSGFLGQTGPFPGFEEVPPARNTDPLARDDDPILRRDPLFPPAH